VCDVVRECSQTPAELHNITAFEELVSNLTSRKLERHRAVYSKAVRDIRSLLTTTEPYARPAKSRMLHPFMQRGMPEVRRDKFNEGVILSKEEFAAAAQARVPPLESVERDAAAALDADLALAIDFIAAKGTQIVALRRARIETLRNIARSLEPLRKDLDDCKCVASQLIATRLNAAWVAALVDSLEWPDKRMPLLYVIGFPVVFDVPDSGVFRADEQPAEISPADFKAGNTRMVARIEREIFASATSADDEERERRDQCWTRTKEEIEEGLVLGPYSKAQMDRHFGRGRWRSLGRNAIKQKGKWRCIDNGKRAKHNKAASLHERITCGRADFPVMVAREFARRITSGRGSAIGKHAKRLRMQHGTNDLRAAYRHVPTSQMEYTAVAVWNSDAKEVQYCTIPGHNFGLASAVLNFNRLPELTTMAARRLLWIVNEHYYDDADICEPAAAHGEGQEMLVELHGDSFVGFPFDPSKDVIMNSSNEYLGVESSFDGIPRGVLIMDVTAKRRRKLKDLIDEVYKAGELRSGLASSLFGKAGFALSPCYSSLGRACLLPIKEREYQKHASEITDDIDESLDFIRFLCDHLPPLELPLVRTTDTRKVVVFTDAEGKKRSKRHGPTGHLGFVVDHPVHGRVHADAAVPREIVELLDAIKKRQAYIGQWELIAAITPFISLPADWFAGRPIELWVDNSGAIGSLISGYSGKRDCARIVNAFHFAFARLGAASLWIDYVPSESNPADVPSRFHEMSIAERADARRTLGRPVDMVVPRLAGPDGKWLSFRSIAESVWRTGW
jgi:hypothetical protein